MSKEHFYQVSKAKIEANNTRLIVRQLLRTDKEKAKLTAQAMAREFEAKKGL